MLVGDANDFQEYIRNYYNYQGPVTKLTSDDLRKISAENEITHQIIEEERRAVEASITPVIVTITNPSCPIVYYFVNEILSGPVFGADKELEIRLYCNPKKPELVKPLMGLKMEIEDLASPHLRRVKLATSGAEAFEKSDFIILLDSLGEYADDLDQPGSRSCPNPYVELAEDIDKHAKTTCKILVTPFALRREIFLLTNAFGKRLKRIDPRKQLIGNSMCDEMVVRAILAARLKVDPAEIKNVPFLGQSVDASFYVDLCYGEVTNYDGAVWARTNSHWRNLVHLIADRDWIKRDLINLVHERGF